MLGGAAFREGFLNMAAMAALAGSGRAAGCTGERWPSGDALGDCGGEAGRDGAASGRSGALREGRDAGDQPLS